MQYDETTRQVLPMIDLLELVYTIMQRIPQGGLAVIAMFIFWSTASKVTNTHRTSRYYGAKSEVLLHSSRHRTYPDPSLGITFHLIFGMTPIPSPFQNL